eukprot:1158027-Pelagomonas_calceolata.AAC.15
MQACMHMGARVGKGGQRSVARSWHEVSLVTFAAVQSLRVVEACRDGPCSKPHDAIGQGFSKGKTNKKKKRKTTLLMQIGWVLQLKAHAACHKHPSAISILVPLLTKKQEDKLVSTLVTESKSKRASRKALVNQSQNAKHKGVKPNHKQPCMYSSLLGALRRR